MRTVMLLTVAALGSAAVARAQESRPVIVTAGSATLQRAPEVAFVALAIESRARTPRDAQQQNAAAATAVVNRLDQLGVGAGARRTLGLRLDEEFDTVNGRRVSRGFVARTTIEARVDEISRAGEIADAAVQTGATGLEGVRFDLKDRAAAEREALRLAVADARGRADAAAAGAGLTIDRVIRIEEGERSTPIPIRPMAALRADAVTPVEPGIIEIRVTVTMTTSIK
jgi:uncharacterized protein YggE